MSLRGTYLCFYPVIFLALFWQTGIQAQAQQGLLDREINLSHSTGEIAELLKEISRKGNFSFTYTSKLETHRMASVLNRRQSVHNHLQDIFRYDSIQILEQHKKILLIPLFRQPKPVITFRSLNGIVVDSRTHRPLPFVSIFLANKSTGTVSNASGRFELKVSLKDAGDTLGFSHIGYQMQTMPLSDIDTSMLLIRLTPERVKIDEVVVKPLDPIYILTKAIERIPVNYDIKPSIFTGFFREATLQDNKSISLSEAIIHVFKEPYTSFRNDQIKLYKGRKGSNTDAMEFVEFIVQGGLYNTLQLDIVKNLPTFLDVEYFALYEYKVLRTFMHLGRLTYIISFEQREGVKYPCYSGELYIDVESLAIVGSFFEMPEKGMNYATGIYIKKSPRRTGVKPVTAQYQVFYRLYNGKWNLSNMRSELIIRVRRRKDKQQDRFNSVFSSTSEFVVTNKDTSHVVRFKTDEIVRPRDIVEKQIGETDLTFWGAENIIIPDEPIEKAIIRLGKRNNIISAPDTETITREDLKSSMPSVIETEDEKTNTDE